MPSVRSTSLSVFNIISEAKNESQNVNVSKECAAFYLKLLL